MAQKTVSTKKGAGKAPGGKGAKGRGAKRRPVRPAARPLDGVFHYTQRGGTFGGEVLAGISMALLGVCGIFMNMQLIATLSISGAYSQATSAQIAANGEVYAQLYLASMIVAFVGSLVVGLVARLPLVQVSSLGLSCVLVSTIGAATGLSYYNLLFVCLVSSVALAAIAALPKARALVLQALPAPVRRAPPAAMGLLVAWVAVQLSGVFSIVGSALPTSGAGSVLSDVSSSVTLGGLTNASDYSYATDKFHPQLAICLAAVILAVVVYLVVRNRSAHPCLTSLLSGTVAFLVGCVLLIGVNWKTFNFSLDFLWARIWMLGSQDAMQAHAASAFSAMIGSVGKVFTEGTDFSAYVENGGNVALLFATGVLTFLSLNFHGAMATLDAVSAERGELSQACEEGQGKALVALSAANVVAPLLGISPLSFGPESVVGAKDGAKSGLASVVSSVVFLVSSVVWVIPALLATVCSYLVTFNLYGHYGTVLQLLSQCSFSVADIVMALVGLSMVVRALDMDWSDRSEAIPFVATVALTFLTTNLALGVAFGTISFVLVRLLPASGRVTTRDEAVRRLGGVPTLVGTLVSVALVVLSFAL